MNLYSLTYDDGPALWTSGILDHFESRGETATFYVLGAHVAGNEEVLRRMVRIGCEIGNHGWSHTPMTRLSDEELADELMETERAIRDAVGWDIPLLTMRPPYHARDDRTVRIINSGGYLRAATDCDPGDYGDTADQITEYVMKRLQPGCVVNLHDGMPPGGSAGFQHRWNTFIATGRILDQARTKGWRSESVSKVYDFLGGKHPLLVTDTRLP